MSNIPAVPDSPPEQWIRDSILKLKMSRLSGHFRFSVWDPLLIIFQILTIQCLFYASLGVWIYFSDLATGVNKSLDHLFLYEALHVKDAHGRCIVLSYVVNSLIGAFGLWFLVQRTRLCLDFSTTCYVLHLIVCWIYNEQFPDTISWWLLNVACVAITCICGEFLCMRTELKAIPLSLGPKSDL